MLKTSFIIPFFAIKSVIAVTKVATTIATQGPYIIKSDRCIANDKVYCKSVETLIGFISNGVAIITHRRIVSKIFLFISKKAKKVIVKPTKYTANRYIFAFQVKILHAFPKFYHYTWAGARKMIPFIFTFCIII